MRDRHGFTLVELLVVITIIAVLISLLTPAMEQAIYSADQTLCASQLKAFGTALTTGALQRQRKYPERKSRFQPIDLSQKDLASGEVRDERGYLREYLGLELNKLLNCPLSRPVDIDKSADDSIAQTSYAMWYGWPTGPTETVMRKLGDTWTYDGDRFRVLANDYELGNQDTYYCGQPDQEDVLIPYIVQDAGLLGGWDKQTTATWYAANAIRRGVYDVNTVYTDNAVLRTRDVQHYSIADERMTFVPNTANAATIVNNWQRVPTR